MSTFKPAEEKAATSSTSNPTTQGHETTEPESSIPTLSPKAGEEDGAPVVKTSSSRKKRDQKQKEEEKDKEQQKPPETPAKKLEDDLRLFTLGGGMLLFPSREKPVSVEQLAELGTKLDQTIVPYSGQLATRDRDTGGDRVSALYPRARTSGCAP